MYIPEHLIETNKLISDNVVVDNAHQQFNRYLNTLSVIKQISLICRALQKHRGLSLSILAGYEQFRPILDDLDHQITRRMLALETFSKDIISNHALTQLQHSWETISKNWQNDSFIDNFELHSYFLSQLFEHMMALARTLELPFLGKIIQKDHLPNLQAANTLSPVAHLFSVIIFCCQKIPMFTEQLAKLRGLSALTLNLGIIDKELMGKLRYFLQCARIQHESLYDPIEHYSKAIQNELVSLPQLKQNQEKLFGFFELIAQELIDNENVTLDSKKLFEMASEVIDQYWQVVDQGINLMTKWQDESLEQWFCAVK